MSQLVLTDLLRTFAQLGMFLILTLTFIWRVSMSRKAITEVGPFEYEAGEEMIQESHALSTVGANDAKTVYEESFKGMAKAIIDSKDVAEAEDVPEQKGDASK